MKLFSIILLIFFPLFLIGNEKIVVRIGHFPNLTHAQGVIAHALTRQKRGWFEKYLGKDVEIQWFVYSAGPSAMESIFSHAIDLTYVGPSPTINAYIKSKGEDFRIICGACSGGAALVVRKNGNIHSDSDFKGKRIGTPQFGNTQDIAARAWLKSIGLNVTITGGDAYVIPTPLADQMLLLKKGDLDAVWTIEPWVSQLLLKADCKIYLEESSLWKDTDGKYVTTHLVSSKRFIDSHSDLLQDIVKAHIELTKWINDNPEEAKKLFLEEIKQETHFALDQEILNQGWERIELTSDPIVKSLYRYAQEAFNLGFLKQKPDLSNIYDLQFLSSVGK